MSCTIGMFGPFSRAQTGELEYSLLANLDILNWLLVLYCYHGCTGVQAVVLVTPVMMGNQAIMDKRT